MSTQSHMGAYMFIVHASSQMIVKKPRPLLLGEVKAFEPAATEEKQSHIVIIGVSISDALYCTAEAFQPDCLKTRTTEHHNYKIRALALIRAPTLSLSRTLLKPLATSFVASAADLLWEQESKRQNPFKTHGGQPP